MSEVKTPPIKASHVPHVEKVPGSFSISAPDDDGEQYLWYGCPCGCGPRGPIIVGNGFKPKDDGAPTWEWNGSLDAPTLRPSVWHKGHWHGHLQDGIWKSC